MGAGAPIQDEKGTRVERRTGPITGVSHNRQAEEGADSSSILMATLLNKIIGVMDAEHCEHYRLYL